MRYSSKATLRVAFSSWHSPDSITSLVPPEFWSHLVLGLPGFDPLVLQSEHPKPKQGFIAGLAPPRLWFPLSLGSPNVSVPLR